MPHELPSIAGRGATKRAFRTTSAGKRSAVMRKRGQNWHNSHEIGQGVGHLLLFMALSTGQENWLVG